MKVSIGLLLGLIVSILAACQPLNSPELVEPDDTNADIQEVDMTGDAESAELNAREFMDLFAASAPTSSSEPVGPRLYDLLSEKLKQSVSEQMPQLSSDLARVVGVQDLPDQGISTEDMQIISPTEIEVIFGLNYSGSGRELRRVNMIWENSDWKVDGVESVVEEI